MNDVAVLARALRSALEQTERATPGRATLVLDLLTGTLVEDLREDNAFALARAALEGTGEGARMHFVAWARSKSIAGYLREQLAPLTEHTRIAVLAGDVTATLPVHLRRLAATDERWRTATSIAVVDPFRADVPWSLFRAIASFRRGTGQDPVNRVELWLFFGEDFNLHDPAQLRRGPEGEYARRMLHIIGDDPRWIEMFEARSRGQLDPQRFQADLMNLVRWKLESELGYARTTVHRFPLPDRRALPSTLVIATAREDGHPRFDAVDKIFGDVEGGTWKALRGPARPIPPKRYPRRVASN